MALSLMRGQLNSRHAAITASLLDATPPVREMISITCWWEIFTSAPWNSASSRSSSYTRVATARKIGSSTACRISRSSSGRTRA
jgi:hypothetical protein